MKPKLYIDVMEHGRFLCQIPYFGHGFPELIDGKVETVYDSEDLLKAVLDKRPSLTGRKINLALTTERVIN